MRGRAGLELRTNRTQQGARAWGADTSPPSAWATPSSPPPPRGPRKPRPGKEQGTSRCSQQEPLSTPGRSAHHPGLPFPSRELGAWGGQSVSVSTFLCCSPLTPHQGREVRGPNRRGQASQSSGEVIQAVEEPGRDGGATEPAGCGEEGSRRGGRVQWLQLWALQPGCPGSDPSSAI